MAERRKRMTELQKVAVTKNGKTYYLDADNRAVFGHYLFADGKTYHKYLDCYKFWSDEYRSNFTGWQAIPKKEIKEMHLRYCKFCQERQEDENEPTHYEFLPVDSAEKKPVPKWLKILFIVVLVLFVAVLAIVIFAPDPDDADSTTAATEATEPTETIAPSDASPSEPVSADSLSDSHFYDQSSDIPVIDTKTNQRKGTFSIIKTSSALVTDELLVDWYENHVTAEDAIRMFFDEEHYSSLADEDPVYQEYPDDAQLNYISRLVELTELHHTEIDELIARYSDSWKVSRLTKSTLAVLRCAVCEIRYMDEIPNSAAINEAVELGKKFDSPKAASYINGILGSLLRSEEQNPT